MLLIWRTGKIFQIRNLLYCPTAFEIHHHFIMRWRFSLDVLCVKEHEHWYSGIYSEFIMHNTRVIGLQIASKRHENVRRIASLVWLAMWNVHGQTQRKRCTTCSVSHWKFLKKGGFSASWTAFDCSRLGYSDNDQVSGPVEFENFMNSIHVYLWVQSE